jgi:hypothetical protein
MRMSVVGPLLAALFTLAITMAAVLTERPCVAPSNPVCRGGR